MTVPTYDRLLSPILALAVDNLITRASATEEMCSHLSLSVDDREARIPSGGATYIRNRVGWAMTFLTKAGLIEKCAPAQYRATAKGCELLRAKPNISVRDLEAMEGWHEAWKSTTKGDEPETENDEPETNEDRIRLKIARAIQNPEQRTAALRFMAFAVEAANEDRSDAWVLRELTDGLELMVGRLVACRIRKSGIRVSVVGPISEDDRAALDNSAATDEPWAAIVGGLYIKVAAQKALALDLLEGRACHVHRCRYRARATRS